HETRKAPVTEPDSKRRTPSEARAKERPLRQPRPRGSPQAHVQSEAKARRVDALPGLGLPFASTAAARPSLALDDVMHLKHLGLAGKLDTCIFQDRHEALTEGVELLARVPDFADPEVTFRTERNVVGESFRRPIAQRFKAADSLVVLLIRDRGSGVEAGKDARCGTSCARGRRIRIGSGGHFVASFAWDASDRADLQPNPSYRVRLAGEESWRPSPPRRSTPDSSDGVAAGH